jgi:hypothetical protein
MIGGADIHSKVPSGPEALDFVVKAVFRRWKDAVVVMNRDPKLRGFHELEFHGDRLEMIVYEDAACACWRDLGYDESLKGTMMYFISDPDHLTLVTEEDASPEIQLILDAIRAGDRGNQLSDKYHASVTTSFTRS